MIKRNWLIYARVLDMYLGGVQQKDIAKILCVSRQRALLWDSSSQGGLPGQFHAPLQLHRGLDRLDALASRSNRLAERSPEPLIGFDQLRVLIRRGNRRL
jgi:hypothetical protein